MQRKRLLYLLFVLTLILSMLPATALAQDPDSEETLLEQAKARAAEQNPTAPESPSPQFFGEAVTHPLFVGVDDTTVPAYQVNVVTNGFQQAFVGFQVWGSAYDPVNDKVYFNNGSTLYEWPVGGVVATLGTITDPAGATQSMTGLAFYNGVLYGVKNIANEAIYAIDTTTRIATVHIDYVDADFDLGGFSADPNTGEFYATNDDTTPNGSGLFRINANGTGTLITPYPAGQTDIDGLAVSDDGRAYLVTDEPGFIYVWDFVGGAYATPLNNPWTSSEVFSAGAWIWEAVQEPSISLAKTVGTDPSGLRCNRPDHRCGQHGRHLLLRGDQHRRRDAEPPRPGRQRAGQHPQRLQLCAGPRRVGLHHRDDHHRRHHGQHCHLDGLQPARPVGAGDGYGHGDGGDPGALPDWQHRGHAAVPGLRGQLPAGRLGGGQQHHRLRRARRA